MRPKFRWFVTLNIFYYSCNPCFTSQLDIGDELAALEEASKALVDGVDQILLEVHMHISEHAHDSAKPEHFEQVG